MHNLIHTIGHSNINSHDFIHLLKQNDVNALVDIRSVPYSKYTLQFNRESIEKLCKVNNIFYLYLGDMLGGKPNDASVLDIGGEIDYCLLGQKDYFLSGINQVLSLINEYNVCLMCSEGKPDNCHRNLLVTPILEKRDVRVLHIMPDGSILDSFELLSLKNNGQLVLF